MSTFVDPKTITEATTPESQTQEAATAAVESQQSTVNSVAEAQKGALAPTVVPPETAGAVPAANAENAKKIKIIDWDEALSSAGGNKQFLKEVLDDLLKEAEAAESDIVAGIEKTDFNQIMKAAHRMGGSASYFCCEGIMDSANKLKHLAQDGAKPEGASRDKPAILADILVENSAFAAAIQALRDEVNIKLSTA
jgi:HPt (histidine-containing phosphotransfer) domain-containing protein